MDFFRKRKRKNVVIVGDSEDGSGSSGGNGNYSCPSAALYSPHNPHPHILPAAPSILCLVDLVNDLNRVRVCGYVFGYPTVSQGMKCSKM